MSKKTFPYPGRYTFVDVEIPNIRSDSVCAISMIVIEDGQEVLRHTELINPRSFFSPVNVSIHHIRARDVQNARTFRDFWLEFRNYFTPDYILVGHNISSDLTVMLKDLTRYRMSLIPGQVLDTMEICEDGYYHHENRKGDLKLDHICEHMGIPIDHHNPESDVNACVEIIRYMHDNNDLDLNKYLQTSTLYQKKDNVRPALLRHVSQEEVKEDNESRDFIPYFQLREPVPYQPFFDLPDGVLSRTVAFRCKQGKDIPAVKSEMKKIRQLVREKGGRVIPLHQAYKADAVIEFMVPGPEAFLKYKTHGVNYVHALDILKEPETLNRTGIRAAYERAMRTLKKIAPEDWLNAKRAASVGTRFFYARNLTESILYLEMAIEQKAATSQPYLILINLYRKGGLQEEEIRVLKAALENLKPECRERENLEKRLKNLEEKLTA